VITPVNGHVLIEPVKHESFVASLKETYQEIGTVVAMSKDLNKGTVGTPDYPTAIGQKVYFDSWLAAKYPKDGGGADDFYWLIKWEDVRAVGKDDAQPA
jgi:co-chaperonin GroES (HSP10)